LGNAIGIIAEKWGIEFVSVAGCIVNKDLMDSIKHVNEKSYKLIEAKYGKSWEDRFESEVEAEYNIETHIDSLIKEQAYIRNKNINNPFPGSPFPMHPIDKDGVYIVTVSTYNRDWKEEKLYKLKVNYKKNLVDIIKDYTLSKNEAAIR
jgi:hypothetical protein